MRRRSNALTGRKTLISFVFSLVCLALAAYHGQITWLEAFAYAGGLGMVGGTAAKVQRVLDDRGIE